MKNQNRPNIPQWYQVPMVWMIISIPLSAVIVGMIMLTFSITTYDGLVADDYYKRGKEINRVLHRDAEAAKHHITATVFLNNTDSQIKLDITHNDSITISDSLELKFFHPTRSGEDKIVSLQRLKNGSFRGRLPELSAGRWITQVDTEHWRISGGISIPGTQEISLSSG